MPHVSVQLLEGRTIEQKRAASQAITDALIEHCGAQRESVVVVFVDIPRDSWCRAGTLVADRDRTPSPPRGS
ncbi:MAG TPA: tautomerase family protein [Chloroflexota bacterium]|jgi:4-oxalocrotonate tautomerase|nr:tautomerase family protein [Chloroflexota bacterium]